MYQVAYFLTRNASMFPNKCAVAYKGQALTYLELNQAANRAANGLMALGLKKGDRIALMVRNSLEFVILWYASQKAGIVPLPINLRLLSDEIAHIINDSESKALIYFSSFSKLALASVSCCPRVTHLIYKKDDDSPCEGTDLKSLLEWPDDSEPQVDIKGEDESVILYTSGTTGRSKGVMHTQQMVREYSYMKALESDPPNTPSSVLVQSPIFHLGGMQHIWRMAALSGTLVMVNKFLPEEILGAIEQYHVNELYVLPPILIKRLYDFPRWKEYDLSSVRCVMCTGGKCSQDIANMIFELFPGSKIRLSYGSTEIFGPTTAYISEDIMRTRPELATTIGTLNNQVELRLVDENMNDVPDGTPGEALVRSPMIFRGYLNMPEKSTELFEKDGYFHTGDVLRRTSDGYYFMMDRIKDMIKTGGENVFAQEVESILRDFDGIFDCAVIGIPDPEMGEAVAAAIVTNDGGRLDPIQFVNKCKEKMPGYRKPRYWCFMKELPTNSVGKIQKQTLREHPEWFEKIK